MLMAINIIMVITIINHINIGNITRNITNTTNHITNQATDHISVAHIVMDISHHIIPSALAMAIESIRNIKNTVSTENIITKPIIGIKHHRLSVRF